MERNYVTVTLGIALLARLSEMRLKTSLHVKYTVWLSMHAFPTFSSPAFSVPLN